MGVLFSGLPFSSSREIVSTLKPLTVPDNDQWQCLRKLPIAPKCSAGVRSSLRNKSLTCVYQGMCALVLLSS